MHEIIPYPNPPTSLHASRELNSGITSRSVQPRCLNSITEQIVTICHCLDDVFDRSSLRYICGQCLSLGNHEEKSTAGCYEESIRLKVAVHIHTLNMQVH